MLPGRNDADMGPANSLHASVYYSEYNERFDWIKIKANLSLYLQYYAEAWNEFAGPSLRHSTGAIQLLLNVEAVASRLHHCVRFDLPGNLRSPAPEANTLPLQQVAISVKR